MIKGHVTIDIHNHNSGFTERIEQDNLVTDAVGILASVYAGANMTDKIMPLATKALGGLMLFDGALEEEKSNIFFPSNAHLTGFAGQWVNTSNPFCGSLNVQETHATDTGYETVWDFSTSQANGTIASLALTAAPGGDIENNPFTSIDKRLLMHEIKIGENENIDIEPIVHSTEQMMYYMVPNGNNFGVTQEYDASRNIYTTKVEMQVKREYLPIRKYKIADKINEADNPEKIKDIVLTIESKRQNILKDTNAATFIINAYDGYAYIAYSEGNDNGDGSFSYQRIKISDYSFDVEDSEKVILPNTRLNGGFAGEAICKGKCFIAGKDDRYIYIVDLANTADVKTADLGEGWHLYVGKRFTINPSGTVHIKVYQDIEGETSNPISDAIVYPDGEVRINKPYAEEIVYGKLYNKIYGLGTDSLVAYDWKYGYQALGYLGTICNLTSQVTKTAASSMKITYTLTDEVQT